MKARQVEYSASEVALVRNSTHVDRIDNASLASEAEVNLQQRRITNLQFFEARWGWDGCDQVRSHEISKQQTVNS
jgi:hypothetical protein